MKEQNTKWETIKTVIIAVVLAMIIDTLGLAAHITMSVGEEDGGGRDSASMKEDVCEALIGALYLDAGYEAVHGFVAMHWKTALEKLRDAPKDAKTALQEAAQARGLGLPEYVVLSEEGPSHAPLFRIAVRLPGMAEQQARAGNKRKAEQEAAASMLEAMDE